MKKIAVLIISLIMGAVIFPTTQPTIVDAWNTVPSDHKFIVNGEPFTATAVIINGHNYVRVVDIAEFFDIDVSFDHNSETVYIDTQKPFTPAELEYNENRIVISVTISSLAQDGVEYYGPFPLESGDSIACNLTANGNGSLYAGFSKERDYTTPYWTQGSNAKQSNIIDHTITVSDTQSGSYYLWIWNQEEEPLTDIRGSVVIEPFQP